MVAAPTPRLFEAAGTFEAGQLIMPRYGPIFRYHGRSWFATRGGETISALISENARILPPRAM